MAKKRILLVDDEPDFVWMTKSRLEANNYDVHTACNGKEAIEKIKAEKPEVVLLDIFIPGTDGLAVLRMIRRHDKRVPIYIITASSNQQKFLDAKRFGASGFIVKTSNFQKEIDNITNILRLSGKFHGSSDA